MKIIAISGSIKSQKTLAVIKTVLQAINEKDETIETELISLGDYDLSFSDGRDYRDYVGDTNKVISKIMSADAYIIGTPTYQSSIPGSLKNLFDLLPKDAFVEKVAGIIATAGSDKHYLLAETQLKPILSYMKAIVVPKYIFINEAQFIDNKINDDEIDFRLRQLANDTLGMIQVVQEWIKRREDSYNF